MKQTLFIFMLVVSIFRGYYSLGQRLNSIDDKDNSFISMNDKVQSMFRYGFEIPFAGLVIGYEQNIGKGFTILPELGFTFTAFSMENTVNVSTPIRFLGKILIRKYYNIRRRVSKRKNTRNNAFSYVGILPLFFSKPLSRFNQGSFDKEYSSIAISICWGVQRNFGKKTLFDFLVGIGPSYVLSSLDNRKIGLVEPGGYIKFAFLFYD